MQLRGKINQTRINQEKNNEKIYKDQMWQRAEEEKNQKKKWTFAHENEKFDKNEN